VLPELERTFEVFACDSPGFGASAPLPDGTPRTIAAYTDAFAAFISEQRLERPHVAGNSMGGAIAIELARRGLVRSATALSPAGFWTAAELRYARASLQLVGQLPAPLRPGVRALLRRPRGRQLLIGQLVKRPADVPAAEAVADAEAMWASSRSLTECLEAFGSYRCTAEPPIPAEIPVTVAWGDRDLLLLRWLQAPRARRILPSAEHTLTDAGHLPYSDCPDDVVATIRRTAARAA
jgi:pimeloyl-ACP methyl ester carboxylesterase